MRAAAARVATGLLLTAPGIPMLFMGRATWRPSHGATPRCGHELDRGGRGWKAATPPRPMSSSVSRPRADCLRRAHPALSSEMVNAYHVNSAGRVLAFQRWLDGIGRDIVVVASLNESTSWSYELGFPGGGLWLEVFNSDVYDNWVNPLLAGNGGQIWAGGPPMHGMPASAAIVIPANGVVVFARDAGIWIGPRFPAGPAW